MFQKVKPYMEGYGIYTKRAAVSVTAAVICSVIPYLLLYQIIAPLLDGGSLTTGGVMLRVGIAALCLCGNAILYVHGLDLSHYSAYHTLQNLRTALQGKLEAQPLGAIRDLGNGRIKKVFTDDIETIELLLAHAIPEGIGNLVTPAVVILAMFFVDWKLALLSVLSLPFGMLAMGMMFKAGMSRMDAYYAAGAKMNNTIIEYVNGMEVVKVFNRDGESYERFERDINDYRDMTLDWYRVCWPWMALYSSILPCVALFTLPVGGWFVLKGWSSLADFVLILCMTFAVGAPLLKAVGFAGKIPQLNYKVDELERLLDHPPLRQSDKPFAGKNRDIRFENVRFSYKDTEVIHGADATREEVEEAARKARCYDFIKALPDGFDTVIGEGGASLSGGEMQRISIARCILKDAPIVILDEATASVDADNESHIQAAISELVRGKTLLVIAHRLNTIEGADQILVLEDGRIAERGDHGALMKKNGLYAAMVKKRSGIRGFSH